MRRDRPSWQCRSRKRELPGHGRVTAQQGPASPGTRVTRAREPLLLGSTPGYRHGAGTSSLPLAAQDARPAAMRGETRSQADATGCAQRLRQTPASPGLRRRVVGGEGSAGWQSLVRREAAGAAGENTKGEQRGRREEASGQRARGGDRTPRPPPSWEGRGLRARPPASSRELRTGLPGPDRKCLQ